MRSRLFRSSTLGGAAVLAAAAALVVAGWGGSSAEAAGGSSTAKRSTTATGSVTTPVPSTTPISLPARLDGLENPIAAARQRHAPAAAIARQRHLYADATRLTTAAYTQAYGGVAVGVGFYTDASQEKQASVIAVRAPSPGLTIGVVTNPADAGLAMNQRTVRVFGDVACVVQDTKVVASGFHVKRSSLEYTQCQRAGSGLTVDVFSNLHGDDGRREAVALTDSVYRTVAGG